MPAGAADSPVTTVARVSNLLSSADEVQLLELSLVLGASKFVATALVDSGATHILSRSLWLINSKVVLLVLLLWT